MEEDDNVLSDLEPKGIYTIRNETTGSLVPMSYTNFWAGLAEFMAAVEAGCDMVTMTFEKETRIATEATD